MLHASIRRMYEEIVLYDGSFGDPIVQFVDFDPLSVLLKREADASLRRGAAVALLVNFAAALDNSDSCVALRGRAYRQLKVALDQGLLAEFQEIEVAGKRACDGEQAFSAALRPVYLAYVRAGIA